MKLQKTDAEAWLAAAKARGLLVRIAEFEAGGAVDETITQAADLVYPLSVQKAGEDVLAMLKTGSGPALGVVGANRNGFKGMKISVHGTGLLCCPLNHRNAEIMREALPYTAPSSLQGMDVTIGVGDRLGIATGGHIQLFKLLNEKTLKKKVSWAPVFAQQSVREITLTDRTYEDVLDSATWAVFQEAFVRPWGADGDHLKTPEWVRKALKIGFTMITADVSDYIHDEYGVQDDAAVIAAYEEKLDPEQRARLENRYLAFCLELDTGEEIRIARPDLARIVLIYQDALDFAHQLYQVGKKMDKPFDFELSIDETETPTLPQAHAFIAEEAIKRGIKLFSVAPRFVGEFQKGIDYIGDKKEFDSTFRTHAAIARHYGYKVSVHSGSDKFTVFPAIGRHTNLTFHLKTAGTNWLQALLTVARTEPSFFRDLYDSALKVFPKARQYYHITPNLDNLPQLGSLTDDGLPVVFDNVDVRQVLHVTYGELLKEPTFREAFFRIMDEHMSEYRQSLVEHIGRHLKTLGLMK